MSRPTPEQSARRLGREPKHASYGETALQSELALLDSLADQRIHKLWIASLKIGSLVGGGEIRLERAQAVLAHAGRVTLRLSPRDVEKTVAKALNKGMQSPRMAPCWGTIERANDAMLRWFDWWESLASEDFQGTKGTSLLRMLAAFAITGITVGKLDLRFSVRQAAEASGLGKGKACELLKPGGEVERRGHLKPVGRRARPGDLNFTSATTWRPILKRGFEVQNGCLVAGTKSLYPKTPLRAPDLNLFHRKPCAYRLHALLSPEEEVTVTQLATAIGFGIEAVRTNLRFLASHGLAERVDRVTWRGAGALPDRDVPAADGIDHADQKQKQFKKEREDYRRWRSLRLAYRDLPNPTTAPDHLPAGPGYNPDEPSPLFDPDTGEILSTFCDEGPPSAILEDVPSTLPLGGCT